MDEVRKDADSNSADLDVGLSFPGPQSPVPSPAPAITTPVSTAPKDIHADIEKILKEVKLPERRDFKTIGDKKKSAPAVSAPETPIEDAPITESPPPTSDSSLSRVHTLKEDLQRAVKINKISLVRAVALEEDKHRRRPEPIEQTPIQEGRRKRVLGVLFTSALLLLLGIAALLGVYFVALGHGAIETPQVTSLVFAEQSFPFVTNNSVAATSKQNIAKMRGEPAGSLGSITRFTPIVQSVNEKGTVTQRLATTAEFLQAIDAHPPEELIRALGNEVFFGLHIVDKNAPVIVATVTSYDHAFAGMLSWESTMNADLSPIFTSVPATILDQNGIPSSRLFKDDVMRNYDVRELKDDNGVIQLYYSFPTPKLLIIAESPYTFPEVLSRLQSDRKL